jgi:hypothetical protein
VEALTCRTLKLLFPEDPAFTVGERFKLICSRASPKGSAKGFLEESVKGSTESSLNSSVESSAEGLVDDLPDKWEVQGGSQLELIVNTENSFLLRALSPPRLEDHEIVVELASYLVGKHEISDLKFKVNGEILSVSPWSLSVRSVQNAQSPAEKPIGPLGPSPMGFPWVSALFLVAAFGTVLVLLMKALFRGLKDRQYLRQITQKFSKKAPESVLYLELRKGSDLALIYQVFFELLAFRLRVPFGLRPAKSCLKKCRPALPPQLVNNILELEKDFKKAVLSPGFKKGNQNGEGLGEKRAEFTALIKQTADRFGQWQKG